MNITVPKLDHDAMMARFGWKVTPQGRLERRIVAALIAHMSRLGWSVSGVHDYEEFTKATDIKSAMELVFNLDGCNVHFVNDAGAEHCVVLVLGNGIDIISDWFFEHGDADCFNASMNAFDVEEFA